MFSGSVVQIRQVPGSGGPVEVCLLARRGLLRRGYEVWVRSADGRHRVFAGAGLRRAEAAFAAEVARREDARPWPLPAASFVWLERLFDRPLPPGTRDLALHDALVDLGWQPDRIDAGLAHCLGLAPRTLEDPRSGSLARADGRRLARAVAEMSEAGDTLVRRAEALVAHPDFVPCLAPRDVTHVLATDTAAAGWLLAAWQDRLPAAVGAAGLAFLAGRAARFEVRRAATRAWRGPVWPHGCRFAGRCYAPPRP